jgi:U3 small nucleolar ribonucleoprotein protein LCP5
MPAPKQIDEFAKLLGEVQGKTSEANALAEGLLAKATKDDHETSQGLSFLELKNHVMLDYLSNLSLLLLRKCSGKSISGEKAVERIAEDRTVLEKMRPIEKKLKYQIDKAIKVAESGQLSSTDPLNFKPNLSALGEAGGDDDEEEEEDDDEAEEGTVKHNKGSKYVAPKNVPAFFEDNETTEREEDDRMKKRTLSKSIMEDLRRQHLDLPEEEHSQVDTMKAQHIAKLKERIRYEEENFMRLPVTKKDTHKSRQMTTMGTLGDEMTYFGDNNFYNDPKGTKRKGGARKSSKGAARKKFKK